MHRNLIDVMRARRKCERSGGRIVVSFLPLRFMGTVTARKEATKSVRLHSSLWHCAGGDGCTCEKRTRIMVGMHLRASQLFSGYAGPIIADCSLISSLGLHPYSVLTDCGIARREQQQTPVHS